MNRSRIAWALAIMTVSGIALDALWPHARDAYAILAAQDDPVALSDIQLNSALRNSQTAISDNIEAALAANDAGLAGSFVDLAREKNIALPDELSQRVNDAIAEENSSSHFAKRFATGLAGPAMPTMSAACPGPSPAISSCSAISAMWCARASIWRWARTPTNWCSALPLPALQ